MRTLSAAAVQQLGVSSSQRLSRSDSGSAPKATQDNGWSPRPRLRPPFSSVGQRTAPASCFLRVVHTKVQGQSPRRAKEARRACEPKEAWCHPAVFGDGTRISHTLRQDRVQVKRANAITRQWRPVLSLVRMRLPFNLLACCPTPWNASSPDRAGNSFDLRKICSLMLTGPRDLGFFYPMRAGNVRTAEASCSLFCCQSSGS